MDQVLLPPGDQYDKKCGEIFLTTNGNVVFHCTLCDNKYSGFHNYFDHVYKCHYTPVSEKKKTTAHLHELMGYGAKNKALAPATTTNEEAIENETFEITASPQHAIETEILNEKIKEINAELVNEEEFDDENAVAVLTEQFASTSDEEYSRKNEDDSFVKSNKSKRTAKTRLKKTVNGEGESHKCPHCEYTSKHKRYIIDHVKRHLDTKKHKCPECDKAFFKKYELISHTRTHTGERPYLCPDCGRGFATSSMLLEHVKRHKNIRDKECEICHMKFYNAKELRIHKAVHSDARPFACTQCEKAFKTRLSLKSHMKIHANKREYQCNYCHATFNQSSGLYSHINNKHNFPTEAKNLETEITEISTNFAWC